MKIIDGHINISETGKWFNTSYNCSYEAIVDKLNEAQIEQAVLLAMPGVCTNNFFSKQKIDRDRFYIFGNIQDFNNVDRSLDEIIDLDLNGVKIHPRFQEISVKSLVEMHFFEKLIENNLPVMICGWQQSNKIPIDDLSPLYIDRLAKKYPRLKIVWSHMGGYRLWDSFTVARSNSNVYLDCSYFLQFFRGTSLETDFAQITHMLDKKIIFGSDFPEIDPIDYLNHTKSIIGYSLPAEKLENIFSKNIIKLLEK